RDLEVDVGLASPHPEAVEAIALHPEAVWRRVLEALQHETPGVPVPLSPQDQAQTEVLAAVVVAKTEPRPQRLALARVVQHAEGHLRGERAAQLQSIEDSLGLRAACRADTFEGRDGAREDDRLQDTERVYRVRR